MRATGEMSMSSSQPNLRLLDEAPLSRELDLATEVFHRINRIIPQNQRLLTVPPHCKVRDAVAQMRKLGYSQIPVVEHGEVLGVFSYRSFAVEAAHSTLDDFNKQKCAPGDLNVDEYLEQFEFARVTEEMSKVFDAMDRDNGVLIGTPEHLIGILTPMDFLRYLYQVASPFVLVSEIELALRVLIRIAMRPEDVAEAAQRCLRSLYKGREDKIPSLLEDMTFDNYQSLVAHEETWPKFEPLLGGTRTRASAKLKDINAIRNVLFHFKRDITVQDHEVLAGHRNWLLSKVKQAESLRKPEAQS
jgi:predicted transcriptional regulator